MSRHRRHWTRAASREETRWVPGYEGLYYITSTGRVFSAERFCTRSCARHTQIVFLKERTLACPPDKKGYPRVNLYRDGAFRSFYVHRLVALAFIGEPSEGQEVAHNDGDPANCTLPNLRWATRRENHADKRKHGTHMVGSMIGNSKLTESQAREICKRALAGETERELGEAFGISSASAGRIKRGRNWGHATADIRLDRIAEQGIPTLSPITTRARPLDPAVWGYNPENAA